MDLQGVSNNLWIKYSKVIPKLKQFNAPEIRLNNRTYRTAGRCYVDNNYIELSSKLLSQHYEDMINIILPHELCHQIDYNINTTIWTMRNSHSKRWVDIGKLLGIELKTYHTLEYIK